MSKAIQRRRGTTAEHAGFTGLVGELTVDTTKNTVVVHDGVTAGGHPLAKENHNHDTAYAAKAHESSTSAHPEMTATDAEVDAGTGSKWVKVSQLIRATVKTISSILPITLGGTGASTPEGARTNLGLGSVATENTVPVAKGGTGATTASAARANLGLGDAATRSVASTSTGAEDSGKLPALDATGKLPSGFIPTVEVSYVSEAGHASTADHATTAGSADTATSATTADSTTNADKVDGYHASKTPNPNTVPVADAAGKLDAGWLPPMEASNLNGYTASQTPGASKIPVADAYGQLDAGWFPPTLSADTLDGYHAQLTPAANSIPVAGPDGKLAAEWLVAIPQQDIVGTQMKRYADYPTLSVHAADTYDVSHMCKITTGVTMTTSTLYQDAYTFVVGDKLSGTVRFWAKHNVSSSSGSAYLRVLKNGVQVIEWRGRGSKIDTRKVDISVNPGDVIKFQIKSRTNVYSSVVYGRGATASDSYIPILPYIKASEV